MHIPVLLAESIEQLCIQPEGGYFDLTYGRGGHTQVILDALNEKGRLIALDRDPKAVAMAKAQHGDDPRFTIMHTPFSQIESVARQMDVIGKIDGILIDCGVSSPQLDEAERGFSFMQEGPLDMRMDPTSGEPIASWLAKVDEKTLAKVLWEYGEERYSRRIARAIVHTRDEQAIDSTSQLAAIVRNAVPKIDPNKHPATRIFQALRIQANNELQELQDALKQSIDILKPSGRLVVISFHSLEDRLAKQFMHKHSTPDTTLQTLPLTQQALEQQSGMSLKVVGKAIRAGQEELQHNPRSRSAVMRVAEKLVIKAVLAKES